MKLCTYTYCSQSYNSSH